MRPSELLVCTWTATNCSRALAGALAANELNILSGGHPDAHDGSTLDIFRVDHSAFQAIEDSAICSVTSC